MSSGLYDALKDAGASDEKARKAAEETAAHGGSVVDIRNDARQLSFDLRSEMQVLRSDLSLLKWMVGTNTTLLFIVLGGMVGLFWKLFK